MKAKYKRGNRIRNISEFERSKALWYRVQFGCKEKTIHRSFLESLQYHTLELFIRSGWIHEAVEISKTNSKVGGSMTWGEFHDYVKKQLDNNKISEVDWRPASDMYIQDIVNVTEYEGKKFVTIPMGMRLWLENGDSIIYVKKQEDVQVNK